MVNSRTTPAQNALLKQLRDAHPHGLPIDDVHTWTLEGLMRRRLATVVDGRATLLIPDGDAA